MNMNSHRRPEGHGKGVWTLAVLALVLGLWRIGSTQAGQSSAPAAKTLYQQALHEQEARGNLKEAIALYERALAAKPDRELAAQALLRMAECHQKLGNDQAQTIYHRVVRDYPEQKNAVALARTRLGTDRNTQQDAMTFSRVWTVDWPIDVSSDGRYIAYLEGIPTDLFLHDTVSGASRQVTSHKTEPDGYITTARISEDGTQAAYDWCTRVVCELRVTSLQGAAVATPRKLFQKDDVEFPYPLDWSRDGKSLAVLLVRGDRTSQIGLLSVKDGSLRPLKSMDWRDPENVFFSPDGRWLAFDMAVSDDSNQRDVFAIRSDGSREVHAVRSPGMDLVAGWSPDGKHLLFNTDRNGTLDLFALGFADGQVPPAPELIKTGTGSPLGITRGGALFVLTSSRGRDVEVATIDVHTGKQIAPAVRPIQRFIGTNIEPTWSSDGKFLAYISSRGFIAQQGESQPLIVIQSVETGEVVQELRPRPELTWFRSLSWAPDGHSFLVSGTDVKGRDAIFQVDSRTGAVSRIREGIRNYEGLSWSSDATRIFFRERGAIVERDLVTGDERQILQRPTGPISLSPDRQWIATYRRSPGGIDSIVVVPVAGGEVRELLRLSPEEGLNNVGMPWTPDGRAVIVRKLQKSCCKDELWLVSTVGDPPRRLDIDTSRIPTGAWGMMDVHPDGRQLAYLAGENRSEVWVLENFLPALKESK